MTGVEAILRWKHPKFGILTPSHFLGVAEDTGLIGPIGEWVIRSACKQAGKWYSEGHPKTVSVNLSPISFTTCATWVSESYWTISETVAQASAI